MELKNKIVVITGSSSGFGRSLAEAFIKEEAKVVINSTNEKEVTEVAKEIGALGICADVTKEEDMKLLAEKAVKEFGQIDIWMNNAGIMVWGSNIEDTDMEKVKKMFDINVFGTMNGSRVALRYMKEKNSGTIINTISTSGISARPKNSAYAASKWAVNGFTKSILEENKDNNILILSVFPGGMKTKLFGDKTPADFDTFLDTKEVAGKVIENLKKENPEIELIIRRKNA